MWRAFQARLSQASCRRAGKTAIGEYWLRQVSMSVCPSVGMQQLVSHWNDFHEIGYLKNFRKPVKKIQA
jgi:hypothetical protein